jgi:hypothetical protein
MPSDLIPIDNSAYHSIVPVKFTLSKQSSHENPILPGGKSAMIGAIPVQGTGPADWSLKQNRSASALHADKRG